MGAVPYILRRIARSPTDMTIIEIAFFVINAGVGVYFALQAAERRGYIGGVLGFVLGFGIAICFWRVLLTVFSLWYLWRPLRPRCKTGKCRANDYAIVSVSSSGTVFICTCGDKYLRKGREFMHVHENGESEPYMIYDNPFGRWHLDDSKDNG